MDGRWTDAAASSRNSGRSIDALLQSRQREPRQQARRHSERNGVAPTFLGLDVRLKNGTYLGFWYVDLDGPMELSADHGVLAIPFRSATVRIRGTRLEGLYRKLLHHGADMIEAIPHAEFDDLPGTLIEAIEVIRKGEDP